MDISQIHACFLQCSSVSIDTRKIEKNAFFIALKGTNFDANTFAAEALEKGASYVLIDNKTCYLDERTILVSDALTTLQQLAGFHRLYLGLPVVALTGSNGKQQPKNCFRLSCQKNTKPKRPSEI